MPAPTSEAPGVADEAHCLASLKAGSKSFSAAARLLPKDLRAPTAALYAFCRMADDLVDEGDGERGLQTLRARVAAIRAGRPEGPVERALVSVLERERLPLEAIDWLLEGFGWDVEGRGCPTVSDTRAYGARVAASVGVLMTALMGRRDEQTLARAADLGVAMQLTNIARDVGEDARMGRLYLPQDWLEAAGARAADLDTNPRFTPEIGQVVLRLLDEADVLYARADEGIRRLPRRCRIAIRAARLIYADIGRIVRARQGDSVTARAYTSRLRKAWLAFKAIGAFFWRPSASCHPALPETAALVRQVVR